MSRRKICKMFEKSSFSQPYDRKLQAALNTLHGCSHPIPPGGSKKGGKKNGLLHTFFVHSPSDETITDHLTAHLETMATDATPLRLRHSLAFCLPTRYGRHL